MEVIVSVAVFVLACVIVLASVLYTRRVHQRKKVEADAAWRKEVSRQKRSNSAKNAALRKAAKHDPAYNVGLQAQSMQDGYNSNDVNNLTAFPRSGNGAGLYGRGDL